MVVCEHAYNPGEHIETKQQLACCRLLGKQLGRDHYVPDSFCELCQNETNGKPVVPEIQNHDPLSRMLKIQMLYPLHVSGDDDMIKRVIGQTREQIVEKAVAAGISNDEVCQALLGGIKQGVKLERALDLAEKFKLFDE